MGTLKWQDVCRSACRLVALGSLIVVTLDAQAVVDDRYALQIAQARDSLLQMMEQTQTPGASVTLSVGGRVVWSEGFGYANLELKVPATPQTKFRIGSVSKALTAGGLTLLYQDGRIDLDKPVQFYLPSFPEKRYPITVRQVAGHLAGIRHYRGTEFLSQKRYATVGEGLDIFKDDTLLFEPGSRYAYSSYGFNLLSAVMEKAAGLPYLDYMQQRLFGPLGMTATVPEYPDSIIPNRSAFYISGDVHTNAPMVDNSYKWAGGGFISTTEDLIRFANAVMSGDMFTESGRTLMYTSQRTTEGKDVNYSVGWSVRREDGLLYVAHAGGSIGGTAMLILVPEKKCAIAVLCNDDSRFTRSASAALKVFLQ